jgi:hypothetical protein
MTTIELQDNRGIPYDIYFLGGIDSQGRINELFGKDALRNAIRMWLISYKGEIIKKPYAGGYMVQWLYKPMTSVAPEDIEHSLRDGFDQDFRPTAFISNVSVIADYTKNQWLVTFDVYVPALKISIYIEEQIKNQYQG